ncbi:MAG: transposase [Rickettsiaceae bacterium]|nr:transposase [Rickettsiaceae bacterium]MDD9337949.1 transposase [Rickettsiaceae bacterium]
MSNYISKNRCKYSIKIHLIFVCKYRKKLLSKAISDNIKQIIFEVSKNSSFSIDIIETDQDHIFIYY